MLIYSERKEGDDSKCLLVSDMMVFKGSEMFVGT